VRRCLIQIFTKELPPYAKNGKICAVRIVAWDVLFSSVVIPEDSSAQFLDPRVAVYE
jgi:hypothetical protein